ncbi:MAG: GAF domain-containing protein [Anaerolineae bacterium]|nr:GAF domain-containing protein [Anaerolineae bacterium]
MEGLTGTSTTLRFLQEENQRLRAANDQLSEEMSGIKDVLKSLRGLQQVISHLDTRVELQPLLDRILYEALCVVDAADGSLILFDGDTNELVFVLVRGHLAETLQGHRMPADTGVAGWVMAHGEPVIANNVQQDERFYAAVDMLFHFRTESLAGVPLISRGRVLGVIEMVNKFSGHPFSDKDLEVLMLLAPIAATAIDLASVVAEKDQS